MSQDTKLDYSGHKVYSKLPEKCRFAIGASTCHSRKFLKVDSFVKLRGTICTRYKCKKCGADYFVAATSPSFFVHPKVIGAHR